MEKTVETVVTVGLFEMVETVKTVEAQGCISLEMKREGRKFGLFPHRPKGVMSVLVLL